MKILKGKVALVTGAGSGIGKAISVLFASEGAKVMLIDMLQENMEAVQGEISRNGGTASCFAADVSNEADVKLLMKHTVHTYGTLHILVNNAGVMDNFTPIIDVSDELWQKVIGVNLNGAFYASREAAKIFLKQKEGNMINIASISGLFGGRAGTAYTVSKHGLIGLTKSIGYQYLGKGIRCNAIAPGGVNTNIAKGMEPNPFGFERMQSGTTNIPEAANPDQIAQLALFLASENSSYINGTVITADGGWTAY